VCRCRLKLVSCTLPSPRGKAAFDSVAQDIIKARARMAMPNVLPLLLLLLPALAACQTSRVQGFSVFRDQRESYILEVPPRCGLCANRAIITYCAALLLLARRSFAHASD
jgi:hypothetical protein